MSDIALSVDKVNKIYKLYDKPSARLKEALGLSKKKCYREHYALSDISFQVSQGETVGIIGTNGSGKSTILKIITGVLNPSGGDVEVNGRISALLELGAGFNMEYTGIENVYLNGTMMGFKKEEIDSKLQDILEFADIGDYVYQPVKSYSSGMFVRLAFAIAINIDPEILIVDEALSVGDVFFQSKCYRKFEEFKEMGKTILFVSHDLGSVSKYCDRVILLNKGKKIAEGGTKEVIEIYKKLLVNQWDEDEATESNQKEETKDKNEWKNRLPSNPESIEYGNKEAEIIDFAVIDQNGDITNTIEKNTPFSIKVKYRYHKDIDNPILAFTIKDLRGTDITGTNTSLENMDSGKVKKGDVQTVKFVQDMTLQGGEYLLSLGCAGYENGELVVYHRLYDICNISVISDKNTIGFYDIRSQVSIKNNR